MSFCVTSSQTKYQSDMDIQEFKDRVDTMKKEILSIVTKFEEDTGICVDSIDVRSMFFSPALDERARIEKVISVKTEL